MSNGFPGGLHFNLNIQGKDDDYNCNQTTGGNSVFIPLYGPSEIQYVFITRGHKKRLLITIPAEFINALGDVQAAVQDIANPCSYYMDVIGGGEECTWANLPGQDLCMEAGYTWVVEDPANLNLTGVAVLLLSCHDFRGAY